MAIEPPPALGSNSIANLLFVTLISGVTDKAIHKGVSLNYV